MVYDLYFWYVVYFLVIVKLKFVCLWRVVVFLVMFFCFVVSFDVWVVFMSMVVRVMLLLKDSVLLDWV